MTSRRAIEPTWADARALAHGCAVPLATEPVDLTTAGGRVAAEDVHSLTPLPSRDASAMDGWAVCGPGPWHVVDALLAGDVASSPLSDGEAMEIATGTALPERTRGVLRREHGIVDELGALNGVVAERQDVRAAGEESRKGELLIERGTRLTPAHVGLAAAAGHDRLTVFSKVTARFIVFGDELLRSGPAREGKVRDSLGPQVPGWLSRMGVDVIDGTWVPDTMAAHVDALRNCTDVDLVITSGGTAAGPVDHVRAALDETSGELVVDTVAVRPGHPMLLGRWPTHRWLLGLPGNPQAAIAALLTLGGPLIAALNGQPVPTLDTRRITEAVTSRGGATRLVLCTEAAGTCTPTAYIGSGMLRGLTTADGFAVIPPAGSERDHLVPWVPLPR